MKDKQMTVGDLKKMLNNFPDNINIRIFTFNSNEYSDQYYKIDSVTVKINNDSVYDIKKDDYFVSINIDVS